MKKYFILVLLIMLSTGLITGCGSKKESKKEEVNEVEGCNSNCTYTFYESTIYFAEKLNLDEYYKSTVSNNYKDIIYDENGYYVPYFLGYELDSNDVVVKGYACGVINDKPFCLEGTKDGSSYENNKKVLNKVYGEENCNEYDYGYSCVGAPISAETRKDGEVNTSVGYNYCGVFNKDGYIFLFCLAI